MRIAKPFIDFRATDYPKGSVTQWFGENPELYSRNVIISGMTMKAHNGHDYVAPHGTPLLAVEDGTISEVKESETGYGKYIRLKSLIKENKHYREWTYGHLSKINCKLGDKVKCGDCVGLMGNTGFVVSDSNAAGFWKFNPYAGTHLHLGLRMVDGNNSPKDYFNGYFGSIDFKEMLPEYEVKKITPLSWEQILELFRILRLIGFK